MATTSCRIEMSTVKGMANVFAEHAHNAHIPRFDFHYTHDPRKCYLEDGVYKLYPYFQKEKDRRDPVNWAEQFECNFRASAEGVIIPADWVDAAIGAHKKLGIAITGIKRGAFDVADQGKDLNCYGSRYGILLRHIESWRGKGSDIFASTERSYRLADQLGDEGFDFDGDGMGAGVRGDARKINDERSLKRERLLRIDMFRGSGAVIDPESIADGTDRKNIDFFENYKAQSWWALRRRFNLTFRAVTGIIKPSEYNPADLISIDAELPELRKVVSELSQPVWTYSKSGKMMIDKAPEDVPSPNHGDAVMMLFAYKRPPMVFSDAVFNIL